MPRSSAMSNPAVSPTSVVLPSPCSLIPERTSSFRPSKSIDALEIDHTGHRVRAVHRGSTAGDRLDAREDELRNQVDVDDGIRIRQRQAPAVEQHEISCFTETTQVERRASRERHSADRARRLPLHELRQLVHRLFDIDGAALSDGFLAVRHDRARRGKVGARDARAGHDDFIDFDGLGVRLWRGLPECCRARNRREHPGRL